ncbi:sulfotransferase family protein [Vibrio splendidus]
MVNDKIKSISFKRRMEYASFVSENYPLVYIETPKCACSTLKSMMLSLDDVNILRKQVGLESSLDMSIHNRKIHPIKSLVDHKDTEIKKILKSEQYTRFTIVRNPYARLASCWSDKIRQGEPAYIEICNVINNFHGKLSNDVVTFREFVLWIESTENLADCNYHWMPMINLLHTDVMNYTDIVKTEDFKYGMEKILERIGISKNKMHDLLSFRVNESIPCDWRALYDEELAKIVYRLYKDDFIEFSYDVDSWVENEKIQTFDELILKHRNLEQKSLALVRARNETISELSKRNIFRRIKEKAYKVKVKVISR